METITFKTINLSRFSRTFQALQNSKKTNNEEWIKKHSDSIDEMLEALPHGSGIDQGVQFDFENSSDSKLIFTLSFHHMDDNGYYDGWTDHKLIVTPTFGGFNIRITGRDKREIKEYLAQLFHDLFTV